MENIEDTSPATIELTKKLHEYFSFIIKANPEAGNPKAIADALAMFAASQLANVAVAFAHAYQCEQLTPFEYPPFVENWFTGFESIFRARYHKGLELIRQRDNPVQTNE